MTGSVLLIYCYLKKRVLFLQLDDVDLFSVTVALAVELAPETQITCLD